MKLIGVMAFLFGLCAASTVCLADDVACFSKYKSKGGISGEFPGSLGTSANTPCQLTRHVRNQAGGMRILEAPAHGHAEIRGRSTLRFVPAANYSGSDSMLVQMLYGSGKGRGANVRFAITVR